MIGRSRTYAALLPGLALCACAEDSALPAATNATLDPISFFSGQTHGEGKLSKLVGSPVPIRVDSAGRTDGPTLTLDQTIREGDLPPRSRRWTMRRSSAGYVGTLTDADGPVRITTAGPRATIRYRMTNGLQVDQQLALQRDRRTILNRLEVSKFGIRLATINETIRKAS